MKFIKFGIKFKIKWQNNQTFFWIRLITFGMKWKKDPHWIHLDTQEKYRMDILCISRHTTSTPNAYYKSIAEQRQNEPLTWPNQTELLFNQTEPKLNQTHLLFSKSFCNKLMNKIFGSSQLEQFSLFFTIVDTLTMFSFQSNYLSQA